MRVKTRAVQSGDLHITGRITADGGIESEELEATKQALEASVAELEIASEQNTQAAAAATEAAATAAAAAGVTTAYTTGTYTPLAPTVSYVITKRIALIGITPQDTLLNSDGWDVQISRDGLTWYCPNILAIDDTSDWYSGDADDYLTIASPILTLGYLPITLSSGWPVATGETYYFRARARCSSPESQSDWTTSGALVAYPTLSADLAAAAVAEANLADSCVTTDKLYASAVTAGKLGVTNLDVDGSANFININARLLYSGATAGAYSAYTGVGALLLTSPSAYAGSYALNYFDLDTGKLRIGTTSKYLYCYPASGLLTFTGDLTAATITTGSALYNSDGHIAIYGDATTNSENDGLRFASYNQKSGSPVSGSVRYVHNLSADTTDGYVGYSTTLRRYSSGWSTYPRIYTEEVLSTTDVWSLYQKKLYVSGDVSTYISMTGSASSASVFIGVSYSTSVHNSYAFTPTAFYPNNGGSIGSLSYYWTTLYLSGTAYVGSLVASSRGSFTGGVAGHYYHSSSATRNSVFDALCTYIPVVGDVVPLSGGLGITSSPYIRVFSFALRDSSTTITIYGLTSAGDIWSSTITNGDTDAWATGNVTMAWC